MCAVSVIRYACGTNKNGWSGEIRVDCEGGCPFVYETSEEQLSGVCVCIAVVGLLCVSF
jgi:hypothetical protein